MHMQPRRGVNLSNLAFFGLLFACGIGWMSAIFLLGKINEKEPFKLLSELGMEAIKAALIGTVAALAVDRYLRIATGETPESVLKAAGIKRIYPNRGHAAADLLSLVKTTKHLQMVGISLRDFLPHTGTLHEIWKAVCERLQQEHADSKPTDERLHVKILLLDPRSGEGHFRHSLEKKEIGNLGLPYDVPQAFSAVEVQRGKLGGPSSSCLQVALYEHCPFAFIMSTDKEMFVEQYDYRNQSRSAALPLITYEDGTPQYSELEYSLKRIWEHADHSKEYKRHHVGTADAIIGAGLKNIFRRDERQFLSQRQIESVLACDAATIDIVAISGKFYRESDCIRQVSEPPNGKTVRLAIVNPVSQQAILRAVADQRAPDQVRSELEQWTWGKHIETRLYSDAHHTINYIRNWAPRGYAMQLHLYSSSVACALLLTQDAAFVEQYVYGRSEAAARAQVLGGEYPVFEYLYEKQGAGTGTIEAQLLAATFNMIWDSFSITDDQYLQRNEKEEFEKNLARLREELGLSGPQGHAAGAN